MRRIQSRGLIAALEEEQVVEAAVAEQAVENGDAVAAPVDPVDQLDNAESLETELLEVQDTVEEGESQEAQVEEAVEVQEALGEYQEALESIAQQGGLDRNGAMILQIGLEQLCARVGIDASRSAVPMPSMESFGGASQRVRATQLAMESVTDKMKQVWAAIVAAIKRAGEWLKGFWKTLTDSNVRLKARAEKVAAAARSAKADGGAEIENGGLANKLHTNGKVEKQFGHDFAEFTSFCEAMAGKVIPAVVDYSGKMAEAVAKSAADQEQADIPFRAADVKSAYSGIQLSAAEGEAAEGLESLKSKQLPGGKALLVQIPTADGIAGAESMAKAKTVIGLFKPATAKATTEKMPAMAAGEAAGVAENVVKVSAAIDSLRQQEKAFDAYISKLSAAAGNFAKLQDLNNDPGNAKVVAAKKKLNSARVIFSALVTRVSNMPANFGSYAMSTSKAALDYAELSLKAGAAK